MEWDPLPKKYIHGALLNYQMNFTRAEANFTKVIIIPPDVINHHVTGLMKYTRYVISLAAVNEIGLGVSSDDVIVWTEEDGMLYFIFIVNSCY